MNLPRLGIIARQYAEEFSKSKNEEDIQKIAIIKLTSLLDERLAQARRNLMHRYDVLKNLKAKDLPFVAGQGLMKGSEGLDPNDSIEPILKQGTWGIGYIGLAETLTAVMGKHHGESPVAHDLAIKIVNQIRSFTDDYTQKDRLNYSCYATPAEGLSGKFIIQDKEKFGEIKGVTDKDYYTNSFHIPVGFSISIVDKIKLEAPFHKLCNAGHITYIEVDGYPEAETIKDIVTFAYDNTNINYIAVNFHMRYCTSCGERIESGEPHCPSCGSTKIQGVSRVTGYLSLDERFGVGKTAERRDRISHTSDHTKVYKGV